jgi:hypothetical protein
MTETANVDKLHKIRRDRKTARRDHPQAHPAGSKKPTAEKAPATAFVHGKGFVPDEAVGKLSILDSARKIASTPKVRQMPAKEAKMPKRVNTDEDVLADAMGFFEGLVDTGHNKVRIVREMALWRDQALQRRDVYEIVHAHPQLAIADATVSTQFQLARSPQWAERLARQAAEA